jgi:hypothetical protein
MSRGRTVVILILAAGWLLLGAAAGCGRKAKPEPLWSRAPQAAVSGKAGTSCAPLHVPDRTARSGGDGPISVYPR